MQLKLVRLLMMRSLRERPLRLLLSTFGIVLGVASFLSISLTNRAALDSVTKLIYDTTGRSQLVITSAVSGEKSLSEKSLSRAQRIAGYSRPGACSRSFNGFDCGTSSWRSMPSTFLAALGDWGAFFVGD